MYEKLSCKADALTNRIRTVAFGLGLLIHSLSFSALERHGLNRIRGRVCGEWADCRSLDRFGRRCRRTNWNL